VTGEAEQLVLVRPQNRLVQLDVDVQQDVVEVDDDVLLPVADDDEEASLLFLRLSTLVMASARRT
jgi:hypothetical protein